MVLKISTVRNSPLCPVVLSPRIPKPPLQLPSMGISRSEVLTAIQDIDSRKVCHVLS